MDKKYVIYLHTNLINGKIYVGQTCQNPETRYGSNGIGYRACPYFYNSIQKYGWDNFKHDILMSNLPKEKADELEKAFITLLDSRNPEKGYNIFEGANGFTSEFSKKLWENSEYKQRISDGNKEKWADEEYHKQRSALYKEQWKDADKRKRRSEQAKKRWANEEFHIKAQQAVLNACKTAVICLETNERFESIKDVCDKYNIHHSNVCRAIRKGCRSGGYHWKYAE